MNATRIPVFIETANSLYCVLTAIIIAVCIKMIIHSIQMTTTIIAIILISDYKRTAIRLAVLINSENCVILLLNVIQFTILTKFTQIYMFMTMYINQHQKKHIKNSSTDIFINVSTECIYLNYKKIINLNHRTSCSHCWPKGLPL